MSGATCPRCALERPIGTEAADSRLVRPYVRDTQPINEAWLAAGEEAPRLQAPPTAEPADVDVDTGSSPAGQHHERHVHRAAVAWAADWRSGGLIGRAVLAGTLASAAVVTALNLTSGTAGPNRQSDTFASLPVPMATPTTPTSPTPAASPTGSADPAPTRSATATQTSSTTSAKPTGPTLLPITPQKAHIFGYAGLCVDDDSNWNTLGNKIKIWGCNRTEAQIWSFGSDGTVKVHDMCMRAANAAPGALVQLWTCDGSQLQSWQLDSDRELVNRGSGLCLTVPGATRTPGPQLQISPCRNAEGQHWTLG